MDNMSFLKVLGRPSIRYYTLLLCGFYLVVVFLFHSRLQYPGSSEDVDQDVYDASYSGVKDENNQKDTTPKVKRDEAQFPGERNKNLDPQGNWQSFKGTTMRRKAEKAYRHTTQSVKVGDALGENVQQWLNKSAIEKRLLNATPVLGDLVLQHRFDDCKGPKAKHEYAFKELGEKIKIFSAYWDPRPNDFDNRYGGVKIRLMSLLSGKSYRPAIKCFFDIPGETSPRATLVTYYEMCENHNRIWGGFILSCEVPPAVQETPLCSVRVSLELELTESSKFVTVPIYDTSLANKKYNFAMCVPPMFGNINVPKLVEFFELSFVLGADHVMIYNFSISEAASRAIQHYVEKGRASIIPWNIPATTDVKLWYHGQSIALQDCLYRHMGRAEYVIFNDIDEFMIPHPEVGDHWRNVVATIDNEKVCGFKFKSAFYNPRLEPLKPLNASMAHYPSLMTALNRRTSMLSSVRTKCMVKPSRIFEMGIHHISKPILASLRSVDVNKYHAVLHHYRTCLPGFGMNCRDQVQDDKALRYGRGLYESVVKSVAEIKYKETIH